MVYNSVFLIVGHSLGIGSSYLFALGSIAALSALIVNDYILKRGSRSVHLAAYFVGQVRRSP